MVRAIIVWLVLLLSAPAWGSSFIVPGWQDADKTMVDDTNMCWAAALSNTLAYTGWDAGLGSADAIFDVFRTHWYNEGSYHKAGLNWWFTGAEPTYAPRVEIPGGGYYAGYNFEDYFHSTNFFFDDVISVADQYLHAGYGVELSFDVFGLGHSVSCYGMEYDDSGKIVGTYITENNDMGDRLAFLPLEFGKIHGGAYDSYVVSGGQYAGWGLIEVAGFEQFPGAAPVPEPGTFITLGLGLLGLSRLMKRVAA